MIGGKKKRRKEGLEVDSIMLMFHVLSFDSFYFSKVLIEILRLGCHCRG